ncbi:hypothetical protein ACO1O0_002307 [Amphichorda felina]
MEGGFLSIVCTYISYYLYYPILHYSAMKTQVALATAGLASSAAAVGKNENLLPLPPMGFNNWARYQTNISEAIFVDAAEAMLSHGLLDAGYDRINLDDAWSTMERNDKDEMVWDTKKFPQGLPWLTEHLKSKGFIPGIYTDAGTLSCGRYPGAEGYEEIDYKTFQSWGFEYLKMDGCYVDPASEAKYRDLYTKWYDLGEAAENPMVFSDSAPAYFSGLDNLTDWYIVMGWAAEYGQLARHSADIQVYPDGDSWASMQFNYDQHIRLARYQKPGFFNDPDFLNYDHPSYSLDEKKTQFALWCSLSAPLIISAEIPAITADEVAFLTNKDLIAVDQDKLIQQATLVSRSDSTDVLAKSLENGDRLLTILNKGNEAADVTVSWERIGLSATDIEGSELQVKDLWTGETAKVGADQGGITAKSLAKHATAVYRIAKPAGPITPAGIILNTLSMTCLTDNETSGQAAFAKCDGSDAQTWRVGAEGQVSSLLRPGACIADAEGKVQSSEEGCDSDAWTYHISGNLVNGKSSNCLTEGDDGTATVTACGTSLNEQVFGLPVGVVVNEP